MFLKYYDEKYLPQYVASGWARVCIVYHIKKSIVFRHTKSPIRRFGVESGRFGHIRIDLVGWLQIFFDHCKDDPA